MLNEIAIANLTRDADTLGKVMSPLPLPALERAAPDRDGLRRGFGQALEELIEELDPSWTPVPTTTSGIVLQFSA